VAAGALAGVATPLVLSRIEVLSEALTASRQALLDWPVALPLLAVLAAPLCEEYIFRGLVFAGLRRSLPFVPAALASAAIFAIVHPPMSMGPVFLLGVLTATARERTGGLLAPMAVHAAFNAGSLAVQACG
ncbi:MAG: CPBP family intramembrane metalloprotease, partial [Planctomycetes bacterium]|nr:CPBP family intramembrane metalloprotease [Planctomycetota bacterium]